MDRSVYRDLDRSDVGQLFEMEALLAEGAKKDLAAPADGALYHRHVF